MESNDSPEIPDRGETSDIPGLPSGEVGRQHQESDRPGVRRVPEGSGEQAKMEETCEIIYGAPTTLAVKG